MILNLLLQMQSSGSGAAGAVSGAISGIWLIMMAFYCFLGLFVLFSLIGWILALVDCVKRQFKGENEKIIWILIIVLVGIIGAIIYYFMVYRKAKAEEKKVEAKKPEEKPVKTAK